MPSATLNIVLNGKPVTTTVADGSSPLLYVLRNVLDQVGPKFGCGLAQCGACTVLVNGATTRSCVAPASSVAAGARVTTLDGLAALGPHVATARSGFDGPLHPLQAAFIAEQAAQCGFCMNGLVMGALSWLQRRFAAGNRAVPGSDEIRQFLSGKSADSTQVYLCRCGTHLRVIRAIQRGAAAMAALPAGAQA